MNTFTKSSWCILLIIFGMQINLFPQDIPSYDLDQVVVTAGRSPIELENLNKNILVLDREVIQSLPVSAIQELLQYASGIDLKQRGVMGTQADIGIRGGSFEQTLIMIDGVKFSDPQTGHHNLNLPLSLDQVERVEILKGEGSRIFGPNAFSGAINFITKRTNERRVDLSLSGGTYDAYNASLHASYSLGSLSNHVTVSKSKSDGHRQNTNYDLTDVSYNGSYAMSSGVINTYLGYADQKFGANGFYTLRFPKQWEEVKTLFTSASGEFGDKTFSVSPKIFFRKKNDEFLLDYSDPDFYQNLHETISYGVEVQAARQFSFGKTAIGAEYSRDEIESTNLGNHARENYGVFVEHQLPKFGNVSVNAGAFLYNYSLIGWKFYPGYDIGYQITKQIRLFGSMGKAFRVPTYTELYYSDPVSKGNENLKSEETLNYETGIKFLSKNVNLSVSVFRKEGKNIIDWVREIETDQWLAENISEINTNGFEVSFMVNSGISFLQPIKIDYTYLDSDKTSSIFESRYLLDHLKNQLIVNAGFNYPLNIAHTFSVRYEDRINFEDHFLVDTQVSKRMDGGELFLKINNLFNKTLHDISGVVLPGRWITVGFKINFGE